MHLPSQRTCRVTKLGACTVGLGSPLSGQSGAGEEREGVKLMQVRETVGILRSQTPKRMEYLARWRITGGLKMGFLLCGLVFSRTHNSLVETRMRGNILSMLSIAEELSRVPTLPSAYIHTHTFYLHALLQIEGKSLLHPEWR